jgi:competence protein ComEC
VRAVAAIPALGLLAGSAFGLFVESPLYVAPLVLSASAAVWAWRRGHPRVLGVCVSVAFFAGGALLARDAWQEAWRPSLRLAFEELIAAERGLPVTSGRQPSDDEAVSTTIVGRLRHDASLGPSGVSLSIAVTDVWMSCPRPVEGGVLLTVAGEMARSRRGEWRAGRIVRVSVQLRRPARYLNPGAPDEERALARRGTTLVGSVKSGALVDVVEKGSPLSEAASHVRAFVRSTISRSIAPRSTRAGAIVAAIVIGDRAGLDDDVQRRLQEAGTYHVVAISGGNIAILVGLTIGLFRVAGLFGRAAMISAIAGLIAYAYLVGGGASVDRATLMAVVYLAGRAIDLRGPPFNALAVTAGLLVATQPLTVVDPAFLLTFGATTGILVVSALVSRLTLANPANPANPVFRIPLMLFAASVAAEAALFPIGAFFFSRVTFAGLIVNFAAIPMMALAQIAGMLTVVAAIVSERVAGAMGWLAFIGAEGLVRSAALVDVAPFLAWRVAPPHWLAIVSYYVAIVLILCTTSRRAFARHVRRVAAVAAGAAAIWILVEPARLLGARGDGRLHVTFIDVGQGDATLIRFPRGRTFLIDAGGLSRASSFDVGDRVVAPLLRRAGIHRLDTLVLTHGDADHIGGAAGVIGEFRPHDVWEGIPVPPFEPLRALRDGATEHRARWVNVQAADLVTIDGVELIVRHPGLADWERQDVRNDDSIVIELRWGDVSIVLAGDIGRDVEAAIARRFQPARLRVLKVPHHGSLTSSSAEFIAALEPRIAVVSAGRSNPFGHPAPAVLQRYREAGTEIFRTDKDGAVVVETDGRTINLQTFTGRTLAIQLNHDDTTTAH